MSDFHLFRQGWKNCFIRVPQDRLRGKCCLEKCECLVFSVLWAKHLGFWQEKSRQSPKSAFYLSWCFLTNTFLKKIYNLNLVIGLRAEAFRPSGKPFSIGFWILLLRCPYEHFHGTVFSFADSEWCFFGTPRTLFVRVVQFVKSAIYVTSWSLLKKIIIFIFFHIFSDTVQKISLFDWMFFGEIVKTPILLSRWNFSRKMVLLEKNRSYTYCRTSVCKNSALCQNFFGKVVEAASYVSRGTFWRKFNFLKNLHFYKRFANFQQKIFERFEKTALYMSTWTFGGKLLFGKT